MDAVEEIKERLSIDDVVGRHVDLKRSGASFKGLCPFHQEKTPSFYVTPARGTYHCFGCGKNGDIFSFIMEVDRLPFKDALQRLATQAGVTLPERERKTPSLKGRMYDANAEAARFFQAALMSAPGERARRYLEERSFGQDAVEAFELGYAPDAREALTQHLRQASFDDRILLEAGLAAPNQIGGRPHDRFHDRLMFPIRDAAGKISGFGGRILGEGHPKYLNSPQTEIFDKSGVLFGIHRASDAIRKTGRAILVEGYLDAARAQTSGFLNVVASLGTAVTSRQLTSLSRLTETVVLALDPDPAGQAAAARTCLQALAEVTQQRGRATGAAGALDLRIARLPVDRGDPDELIRDHPKEWEEAIEQSVPAFEFYFDLTLASLDRSDEGWRQRAIDALLPLVRQFGSSAGWQAIWVQQLAQETGISPQALGRSAGGQGSARAANRPRSPREGASSQERVARTTTRGLTEDPILNMERELLALLLQMVVVPEGAAGLLQGVELSGPEHQSILQRVLQWRGNANYDYQILAEGLSDQAREVADTLRAMHVPLPDDANAALAVESYLARLGHFRVVAQMDRTREALGELAPEDQPMAMQSLAALMVRRREIERRLDDLSKLVLQTGIRYGTIDQDSGNR